MALRGLILLDGVTGTGLGQTAGIGFESMAIGALNAGGNGFGGSAQYYPVPYELFIVCLGGTATVQLQDGDTIAGLATKATIVLALNQAVNRVGRCKHRYLALNVSAISGATLNAYLRFQ